MRHYQYFYSKEAEKEFGKLDFYQQKIIHTWIEKRLKDCENPRNYGKALAGSLQKYWVYRIGHYRVICEIDDKHQIIQIITIGHRSDIYVKMVREEENLYEIEVEY